MAGATEEGTKAFAAERIREGVAPEHFRVAEGLTMSSIGFGTYLGAGDDDTDDLYARAVVQAAALGCNHFDTAINYRYQRSERAVARALEALAVDGVSRDQVVVATKGGFIPFDGAPPADAAAYLEERFIETGLVKREDVVAGGHVLTPQFLQNQLEQSLVNLGLETIDIYYLHNPETQLRGVERDEFGKRCRSAFEFLEEAVASGKLAFYGTATWNAFRVDASAKEFLSLSELVSLAEEVGGKEHHFRFVQLPYNLSMTEAFTSPTQPPQDGGEILSLCMAADALGVHVVSSASIGQGQLTEGLPPWLGTLFKGLNSDAQRSLQFVRSTPGLLSALVGMKQSEHVQENLGVARVAPAPMEDFLKLFEVDAGEN